MNEFKDFYPLEFQNLKKTLKSTIQSSKKITTVDVKFYQTTIVKPECFYKPISKLVRFEIK